MTLRRRWTGRASAAGLAVLLTVATVSAPAAAQPGQWWHDTWQMPDVWQIADGGGVTVAVIDTGVDATVPDLAEAVVPGLDLTGQGGDGTVDHDTEAGGHGTAMASLIASRGNDSGLTGVAPAASILSIANPSGGLGDQAEAFEELATSIRYAADYDAQVVNLSRGGLALITPEECPERVAAAVRYAVSQDVVVVASSGNLPTGRSEYPAACPGVVTVGALDQDLQPWVDSHRSEHVDVAAPAVGVSAIGAGGQTRPSGGTSAATALTSGVVALIRAEYPDATAGEVVTRLLATTQDIADSGRDDATGHGLVRPLEALTEPVPPDAPNPIYEGLDLTDTADPTEAPPPTRPAFEMPPEASGDQDDSAIGLTALLAAGGLLLCLLAVAAVVTLLVVRGSRRRHRTSNAPGSGSPGPGPSAP